MFPPAFFAGQCFLSEASSKKLEYWKSTNGGAGTRKSERRDSLAPTSTFQTCRHPRELEKKYVRSAFDTAACSRVSNRSM